MAIILHIDTALQKALVGLARGGVLLHSLESDTMNEHAAFVQTAIQQVLKLAAIKPADLDAVGVTLGPGSYTGLRVGMSSAKGLCYALGKPLIGISTLQLLAKAGMETCPGYEAYCPMIDARRDEVFAALYDRNEAEITLPQALILTPRSFEQELEKNRILFLGNGAVKWKNIIKNPTNAGFENIAYNGAHIADAVFKSFKNNEFCDLAYAEPQYLKAFHFNTPQKNS